MTADPVPFIYGVIAQELALASSVTVGLMTRFVGLGGFPLNLFFFVSFGWGDASQLYLSWEASFAVLWFVVMVTAIGRYLGLASWVSRRRPKRAPFVS